MAWNRDGLNPDRIVAVNNFSPQTLRAIIDHLEVSTDFEHFVYRESELDAIWSITGFALRSSLSPADREAVTRLHDFALTAHDLVADRRPRDAAEILRSCL